MLDGDMESVSNVNDCDETTKLQTGSFDWLLLALKLNLSFTNK